MKRRSQAKLRGNHSRDESKLRFPLLLPAIFPLILARLVLRRVQRNPVLPSYLLRQYRPRPAIMPPKRKAPLAAIGSDEELEEKPAKKTAAKKDPVVPQNPDAFVNKEFPASLEFDPPTEGSIRIAAWNTAGIRSAEKKGGLKTYVEAEDADIFLVTETKCDADLNLAYLNAKYPVRIRLRFWTAHETILVANSMLISLVPLLGS